MASWNIPNLQNNLKKRNITSIYCNTKKEALTYILNSIPDKSTVCWGGSETLKQIGLIDALHNGNFIVLDRLAAINVKQLRYIYSQCMLADYFFSSANAITADGEIVNMDGNGNRIACIAYGPEKVYLIIGKNKYVENIHSAVLRIKEEAAPLNAKHKGYLTGCCKNQKCVNCFTDECICGHLMITRFNRINGRINVILVNESLGY